MYRRKIFLSFLLLGGIIVFLIYGWRHHVRPDRDIGSHAPSSITQAQAERSGTFAVPQKEPLRVTLANSPSLASADLETAQRIYKSSIECLGAIKDAEAADGQMRQAEMPRLSEQEKKDAYARAEKFLKRSNDLAPLCSGLTYDDLANNIYSSLFRAAQLGDTDAAVCYTRALFPTNRAGTQDYQNNAWQLIRQGLERGDWRVVDTLMDLYGDSNTGKNWFFSLAQRDPAKYYQYAKLLSLGAAGEYGDWTKKVAAGEATLISQDDIAKGDAFAADMYQKYFSKASPPTKQPDYPCQFSST